MPKLSFMNIVGIVLLIIMAGATFALFKGARLWRHRCGLCLPPNVCCLFVQNRDEADCLAELGEARDAVKLVYFNERVVANFNGLVQAQATLKPGFGCSVTDYVGAMPHAGP